MTTNPVRAPAHVLDLLSNLHRTSLEQEVAIAKDGKVFSTTVLNELKKDRKENDAVNQFDDLMRDKFIALDEDKCHFMYQLLLSMGATNVVEAGTSFGVSTIYLALAVAQNKKTSGQSGTVIATENEKAKAEVAQRYWNQCGPEVQRTIDLRVGDLLETLRTNLPLIDLLLLDIWSPLALPTLKIVQPHLRNGAVVLVDNTISGAEGYKDLLSYLSSPGNGFRNMTLPFTNGFGMSVYMPS